MLEVFFDNPKVFSFFSELLSSEKDESPAFRILVDLGVSPEGGGDILKGFVFLGILSETRNFLDTHLFKINRDAPATLAVLMFDDIIEKITKAKLLNDGDSEEISIERIVVDEDISLDDFLKMLENGLYEFKSKLI